MGFKLAVGDVLAVNVKGEANNGGRPLPFDFELQMDRLSDAAYKDMIRSLDDTKSGDEKGRAMLVKLTKGWAKQRLVLDDVSGEPAPFSAEAMECLLSMKNMDLLVMTAYRAAYDLSEKPAGRLGN